MNSGLPVIWWLWWFVASFLVYAILILWFWRVARHETKAAPPRQDRA